MAPNRKQLALALDPLVNTVPLVQAKYLPLTAQIEPVAPIAPVQQQQQQEPTIIRSNVNSDDYWNWPNGPEPKKDLFSANHLEAKLQQDAERRAACTTPVIRATSTDDNDDYWAERVEAHIVHSDANAAVSETTGYWDWPEEASTVQIALILKEELARQEFSGDAMEARLVRDAVAAQQKDQESQTKPEHDDYWSWSSPKGKEVTVIRADPAEVNESYWEWNTETEQVKEQVIATIVAYENVRSLFSAEHAEANLVKDAAANTEQESVVVKLQESNDAYWCWPAEEDDYWNERPQSLVQRAEAMPVQGYWDW